MQRPSRQSEHPFLSYVRAEADRLRTNDRPAESVDEWKQQRTTLRQNLIDAWADSRIRNAHWIRSFTAPCNRTAIEWSV